jgi:hypothetical protein
MTGVDGQPAAFARLVYLEETAQLLVVPKHFLNTDAEGLLTRSLCPTLSQKQIQFLLSHATATKSSPSVYDGPLGFVGRVEQLLLPI